MTDEGIELILTVMEAKELIGPASAEKFDTFVRIYMVPDESGALQTKVSETASRRKARKIDAMIEWLRIKLHVFVPVCDFSFSRTPRVPPTTKHSHFG